MSGSSFFWPIDLCLNGHPPTTERSEAPSGGDSQEPTRRSNSRLFIQRERRPLSPPRNDSPAQEETFIRSWSVLQVGLSYASLHGVIFFIPSP